MRPVLDVVREFVESPDRPNDIDVEFSPEEIVAMYPGLVRLYESDEGDEVFVWEHLCSEADRGHLRRTGSKS